MAKKKLTAAKNSAAVAVRQYPDLHDHLERLESEGLLIRVKEPVCKDQEMHPLVRWQFRGGIKEKDRKAFLFEKPVDARGKSYDIPVAIGILAANRQIYGIGLGADPAKVNELWAEAKANPIAPVEIPSEAAPVHEVVYQGAQLQRPGQGLDGIPVPISTPGWDNAPYISAAHFITQDPDNGIQNIGTYRAMIKAPDRVGCNPSLELGQGIYIHWEKYRARKEKMPAALCIGGVPAISYVAAQKLNYDVDEFAVAGGLVNAPIRVVKAKTVPLMVPPSVSPCGSAMVGHPAAATTVEVVGVGVGAGAGAGGLLMVTLPPVPGEATSPAPQPATASELTPSTSKPETVLTFVSPWVWAGHRFDPVAPANRAAP